MKAAYFNEPGGPEVLQVGEVPTPVPTQREILVRVRAAALNPIDLYVRSGLIKGDLPKPLITGTDVAGVVEAVGPLATRFRRGDRVWASNQGLLGRQGSCAEYVCASEDWFYQIPPEVSDDQAAGVALVGITAHLGLFRHIKLHQDDTLFVNGGTGGVGSMVVQMSKAVGARVITTVGSEEKAELARSWGADLVLNYKSDDIPARLKEFTGGKGVSVWFETQREPDFVKTVELMAPRGRMLVMAGRAAQPIFPVGPFYVRDLSLHGFAMFNASPDEQRVCSVEINRWLIDGKLRVHIGKTFPLDEAAEAHRFLEANTLQKAGTLAGKVLVKP